MSSHDRILKAMIAIMLFIPMLHSVGIGIAIIEIILILFALTYLLNNRRVQYSSVFLLLLSLVLIDKINDVIYDVSFNNIGPIVYTGLIALVFSNIGGTSNLNFVLFIKRVLICAVFVNVCYFFTVGSVPIKSMDRDVSGMLMLYSMLNFYYGRYKWIVLFLSVFVCIFVLEARTMILAYGVFIVGYFAFKRHDRIILKKLALLLGFIFALCIIYIGILTEFVYDSHNTLSVIDFSGRGYIWGVALSILFSSSWHNILFGIPSNPSNLKILFDHNFFEYSSLNESIGTLLVAGHFHNTIVYYLFNTGVFGVFILFLIIYKSLKRFRFCNENYNILYALYFVAMFNGKSITSVYIISTLFMLILFVQLPDSKNPKLM